MNKKIQFYGAAWCGDCVRSKSLLDKHQVDYEYHDVDSEPGAYEFVIKINNGLKSIPTIIFPDGDIFVEPSNNELTEKLNVK